RWLGHSGFVPHITLDSARVCTSDNDTTICHNVAARVTAVAVSPSPDLRFFVVEESAGAVDWIGLDLPAALSAVDGGPSIGQVFSPVGLATWPGGDGYRLIVTQYPQFLGVQYFDPSTRRPVIPGDSADIFRRTLTDEKSVAADEFGNVFVLHRTTGLIMIFDKHGLLRLSFGRPGTDPLGLNNPSGIAVLDETLYIADTGNNRIVRYQKTAVPEN
ncbi:MAG: hypothetical protein HY304_08430, partial [candidate division Zixibacteria bacterium]|nr:hypothetical protein [candidate division Zixibacteria bacterium]